MSDIITGVTNSLLAENEWARRRIAELEAENAALRRDAAAWLAVLNMPPRAKLQRYADDEGWTLHTYDIFGGHCFYDGSTPRAALEAAGLLSKEG